MRYLFSMNWVNDSMPHWNHTNRQLLPSKSIESISEWNYEQISTWIWTISLLNRTSWLSLLGCVKIWQNGKNTTLNMVELALWQCVNDRFMQLNHSWKVNSVPAEHTATAINIQSWVSLANALHLTLFLKCFIFKKHISRPYVLLTNMILRSSRGQQVSQLSLVQLQGLEWVKWMLCGCFETTGNEMEQIFSHEAKGLLGDTHCARSEGKARAHTLQLTHTQLQT